MPAAYASHRARFPPAAPYPARMPEPKLSKEEIDRQYEVYDRIPMSTPDAWGDLESFALANLRDASEPEDIWDEWSPEGDAVTG